MSTRTKYFVVAIVAGVLLVAAFLLFAEEEKRTPEKRA
jgi:hypothetical protein